MCGIFGYVVVFVLNITLTTWRFMFLENLISRVNFMAVTQIKLSVFHRLLLSAFLLCGLILLSDVSANSSFCKDGGTYMTLVV